jgi:serine/threonine protein kinase
MGSEHSDVSERGHLLDEVLGGYFEALAAGRAPDRQEVLALHPDLAAELAQFFADQEAVDRWTASLRPIAQAASALAEPLAAGVLGDFRILREVGRGGMGVVYEAEQVSLRRRVALKVLPNAGMLDPRQLQRFHNEAQAAACLHHTNIVPVHFVGSERGVHFYAMQFIDGQTLAAVIQQLRQPAEQTPEEQTTAYQPADHPSPAANTEPLTRQLTRSGAGSKRGREYYRQVAELGAQAAGALDHAHQRGIVHRDVKPGNLMLDHTGRLWVTDFGLAHIQHGEASLTLTGDLVGTLRYMSPEQALAKRLVIDHRTDVYSLGVTLYELLTLRPACDGKDRQELLRQIAFEEPRRPRTLDWGIPAELETIVLKAMEKNPADRYATAKDLADDLRHWLEERPIRARRPSLAQRLRKWARRHRSVVLTAVAAGLLLLALTVVMLAVSNLLIRQEQKRTAEANRELYLNLYYQTIALAEREYSTGNVGRAEQLLDTECPEELRGWEWHYVKRLRYGSPRPIRHPAPVADLAVSPDGNLLVSVDFAGTPYLWDARSGRPLPNFLDDWKGRCQKVRFSPDGRYLAILLRDGPVQLWDTANGKPGRVFPPGPARVCRALALSPRTDLLAVSYADAGPAVGVCDLATGQERLQLPGRTDIEGLALSPDGQRLAVENGTQLQVWDLRAGEIVHTLSTEGISAAAFSPDGRYLAAAGGDY